MKKLVITIDGPAGAGKTTISRILATRLGYKYIDTGALYRGVAYEAKQQGIDTDNDRELATLYHRIDLKFVNSDGELCLMSGCLDISEKIRSPEISMLASAISAKPVVRECLLNLQRDMGKEECAVFEGRDMGTVVFPDAEFKFFLSASNKVRALRRYRELPPENSQSLEEVEREMMIRDKNDSTRAIAPLKAAEDAIKIDTTDLSIEEVVNLLLSYIEGV